MVSTGQRFDRLRIFILGFSQIGKSQMYRKKAQTTMVYKTNIIHTIGQIQSDLCHRIVGNCRFFMLSTQESREDDLNDILYSTYHYCDISHTSLHINLKIEIP